MRWVQHGGRRYGGRRHGVAVGVALGACVVLAVVGACAPAVAPDSPATTTPAASTVPVATTAAFDRQAIEQLLDKRGAAVIARDSGAFLATSDLSAQSGPGQRRLLRQVSVLPWSRWSYQVRHVTTGDRQARVEAIIRTRLIGVDTVDTTTPVTIDLVRGPDGWRVSAEHGSATPALWESGDLQVEQVGSGLVIGMGQVPAAELRSLGLLQGRAMDCAAAALGADSGRAWVLVVPETEAMLTALLGRAARSLDEVAAVTTPGADRVWVNRTAIEGLDDQSRRIVLQHEDAHVITAAAQSDHVPMWFEEGLAEYIGYLGSGVRLDVAAADVLDQVRSGQGPTSLPSEGRFDGSGTGASLAYHEALTATVWLADRLGRDGLVALYREVADAPAAEGGERALEVALARRGLSTVELVDQWQRALMQWSRSGARPL